MFIFCVWRMACMLCWSCGQAMSVVGLEPYDRLEVDGFAYTVWECSGCHETERRLSFVRQIGQPAQPSTVQNTDASQPPSSSHGPKGSAAESLMWRFRARTPG